MAGSRLREIVSTAMTWVDWSFHGQYFLQFAVETSSQEYWNSCCVLKRRMLDCRVCSGFAGRRRGSDGYLIIDGFR